MTATILSIIASLAAGAVLLLKYYPKWRDKRNAKRDEEIIKDFGESLATSDDEHASELLDTEFRRVRRRKTDGAP